MQYTAKAKAGLSNAISSLFPLQKPPPDLHFPELSPSTLQRGLLSLGTCLQSYIMSDPQSIFWLQQSIRLLEQLLNTCPPDVSGVVLFF